MVNTILPRLRGVSNRPASLKIPEHTTHRTFAMIIESPSADNHGSEYLTRVRSRNQYLRATVFSDATPVVVTLSTHSRQVSISPSIRRHLPSCFAIVGVGFDARVQKVRVFPPVPPAPSR